MFNLKTSKFSLLGTKILDLTNMNRSTSEESVLNPANQVGKQPLRKLQFALTRISKVVDLHLNLLKKQRNNIDNYKKNEQYEKLLTELVNASRTVQQLKQDMYELEIVRQQVADEDLTQFDQDVRVIQTSITLEITTFIDSHSDAMEPCSIIQKSQDGEAVVRQRKSLTNSASYENEANSHNLSQNPNMFGTVGDLESPFNEEAVLKAELVQNTKQRATLHSWEYLRKEMMELNSLISGFAQVVMSQKETLNTIEGHVDTAHENVREGTSFLDKAARYKMAMLPITGAIVGCIVGGPVGLMAGFKIAGVAGAVGGSVLGYTGGRILQKRKVETTKGDIELKDLKTSLSLNDLSHH